MYIFILNLSYNCSGGSDASTLLISNWGEKRKNYLMIHVPHLAMTVTQVFFNDRNNCPAVDSIPI